MDQVAAEMATARKGGHRKKRVRMCERMDGERGGLKRDPVPSDLVSKCQNSSLCFLGTKALLKITLISRRLGDVDPQGSNRLLAICRPGPAGAGGRLSGAVS